MSEDALARIRVVLCRPSHPGNIGAAARAMKTMGIEDLCLVAPRGFPSPEARWMAAHAVDVLEHARVLDRLEAAIADCIAAYALSARPRDWSPPVVAARDAAQAAIAQAAGGRVAFVFGAERAGLTNEEVLACQVLVHIPASARYGSLNLAQAVQVMAYELRVAAGARVPRERGQMLATVADIEGLHAHFAQAAEAVGFYDPAAPMKFRERLRRLFARTQLEREEVNVLRGLLRALMGNLRSK
ncbi:MAG: RNA methyltransferase [Burkholderiales bacterium]|nr:RNA methyltransferase [Burkholderiales bacterium]